MLPVTLSVIFHNNFLPHLGLANTSRQIFILATPFKNKINPRTFYLKLNKAIMLVLLWEQTRQFQYY